MTKKNNHIFLAFLFILLMTMACTHTPSGPDSPFLSEAGPILFISDKSGTNQLYSMNEEGKDIHQLTNDPSFPILDAQWSPDGKKIAVVSLVGDSLTYPGFRRCIFIMNSDGSDRYQLTRQWKTIEDPVRGELKYGGADHPVWSPDSKQIAYTRLMVPESFGNRDIFMIDSNKNNEKQITKTMDSTEKVTEWSQDYISLLGFSFDYTKKDSLGRLVANSSIVVFNQEGEYLRSFGKLGITFSWPIWSKQEDIIAFNSNDKKNQDIYIKTSDDKKIKLTSGSHQYTKPVSWSSNNNWILYNAGNGDKVGRPFGGIYLINVYTKEIKNLTPFKYSAYSYATSWRR